MKQIHKDGNAVGDWDNLISYFRSDLCIKEGFLSNNHSFSRLGNSYEAKGEAIGIVPIEFLAGKSLFQVKELEIYQVLVKNEIEGVLEEEK